MNPGNPAEQSGNVAKGTTLIQVLNLNSTLPFWCQFSNRDLGVMELEIFWKREEGGFFEGVGVPLREGGEPCGVKFEGRKNLQHETTILFGKFGTQNSFVTKFFAPSFFLSFFVPHSLVLCPSLSLPSSLSVSPLLSLSYFGLKFRSFSLLTYAQ